jgi:hypothetical protein
MSAFGLAHHHPRRNVRLDTLVRLRWLAIIGQTTAILGVYFGLDFDLPIWAALAVIALSAWLNVALRLRFHMTQRLEPDRAAWLLAFDTAELAVLLFLTGGLQNPFEDGGRRRDKTGGLGRAGRPGGLGRAGRPGEARVTASSTARHHEP